MIFSFRNMNLSEAALRLLRTRIPILSPQTTYHDETPCNQASIPNQYSFHNQASTRTHTPVLNQAIPHNDPQMNANNFTKGSS